MAIHLRKRRGSEEIPTASFGDVAFLLIIFFILAATLKKTEGFLAELPAGEKAESKTEQTAGIRLRGDQVLLNDKVVTFPELRAELVRRELGKLARDDEGKIVLLEATGDVTYQRYFEVMAAVQDAGGIVGVVREQEGK